MNQTLDDWDPNVGTLNKLGLWGFYSSMNLFSATMCAIPVVMIYKKHTHTAGDIFICLLFIGCIMMSIPCGIQCAINWAYGVFRGGSVACRLEGFFHVSAIWIQFVATALIAWNFHSIIIRRHAIEPKHAIAISVVVLMVAESCIVALGHYSEILMMPSGAYCFYKFDSPVMLYLIGTLFISVCSITYQYRKIYKEVRSVEIKVRPTNFREARLENQRTIAIVFTAYIAVLLLWSPALIATIYELSTGSMSQALDTLVGVSGSLHGLAVAIVYFMSNSRLRDHKDQSETIRIVIHSPTGSLPPSPA